MRKLFITGTILIVLCGGLYSSYVLSRPERIIGLGERIHHDDFDYSVLRIGKFRSLGSSTQPLAADGIFYVVTLKVENNAKRVGHVWNDSMAYVVDEKGNEYRPSPEGQKAWDAAKGKASEWLHNTPAGAAETTEIVYNLPVNIQDPCLKIWKDVLMGDMFDGIAYRKIKVKLEQGSLY